MPVTTAIPVTPEMKIPPHLRPLLSLFAAHGERAYPVGGCVRDTLMGILPHDWDVAVTTAPERTASLCESVGYRTVPTGIHHGTITVLVPYSGDASDREGAYDLVECTTCRTEGGYSDGRHPDSVTFTGRIADDLSRRDFTVNAMAFDCDPADDGAGVAVVDLFGGREDLTLGVIRAVGDPDVRFSEDALRLLRAVRFAVKLDFAIEENTRAAVLRRADGLARVSRERISDEFRKILTSPRPEAGVTLLTELGLMPHVLPDGISPRGMGDLSALPADFATRMACLVWGMEDRALARSLTGLRLPNATSKKIQTLARATPLPDALTPRNARQWRSALGELAIPALEVRAALGVEPRATLQGLADLVAASEAAGEPVRIPDLAVNGNDLIAVGFRPGRQLQATLCELLETVWDDPTRNTRDTLLAEAVRRMA